jgi:hypothetical protein
MSHNIPDSVKHDAPAVPALVAKSLFGLGLPWAELSKQGYRKVARCPLSGSLGRVTCYWEKANV